jgi:hypothetical protein
VKPGARRRPAFASVINLKEFVMNETPELQVVDLGEAKELTKGWLYQPLPEDNVDFDTRPMP